MKEYSKFELIRINEQLRREFIKKGEFLKIIKDVNKKISRDYEFMRDQLLELEKVMLEVKRELEGRVEKIERKLAELEEEEEKIRFKLLPKEEALKLVKEYIKKHPGCLTSDIIESLQLDPALVIEILRELEEKGEVEGREPK